MTRSPYEGPNCEEQVIRNLSSCANTCEHNPHKGRRCLRKLRRSIVLDEHREGLIDACSEVFECPEEDDAPTPKECQITTQGCSVGGSPPLVFAALGLFGLWARRRRDAFSRS